MTTIKALKGPDQPICNVLPKCAHYSKTAIKVLCQIEPNSKISHDTLDELFLVSKLRSSLCRKVMLPCLLVDNLILRQRKSSFAAFRRTHQLLSSLETLRSAATLTTAGRTISDDRSTRRGQGFSGYASGWGGSYYHNYRQDRNVFHSITNRSFPNRRQPREDNHSSSRGNNGV